MFDSIFKNYRETILAYTCPRCLGGIPNNLERGAYPGALSRTDNKTEICSECGVAEALEDFCSSGHKPQTEWEVNRKW